MQRPGILAAHPPFDVAQGGPELAEGPRDDRGTNQTAAAADGTAPAPSSVPPRPRPTLPKQRRIRRRGEFGTVFDRGTRMHGRFFTLLLLRNGTSVNRLGIVASRKLGGAVERNRAKRLIRELFRHLEPSTAAAGAVDVVVIPRRELLEAEFTLISKDFGNTWRRGVERLSAHGRG